MNSWPNAFVRFDNGGPLNRAGFEFCTQVRDSGASKFTPSPCLGEQPDGHLRNTSSTESFIPSFAS